MALTEQQVKELLTIRITDRIRELAEFSLQHPGLWPELEDEYGFLCKRLAELRGKK